MSSSNILILSPHPDDEIIGLGGLILQILQRSGKVHIVYLTDGENSNSHPDKERIKEERFLLTEKVLSELRIPREQIYWLHLEDCGIARLSQKNFSLVSERLKEIIDITQPDAVFATHFLDKHVDHIACFELAKEAVRKANHKSQLWLYWVWAPFFLFPWELHKTLKSKKINIDTQYRRKQELMDLYLLPKSPSNYPWSGYLPKILRSPLPNEIIEKYDL